MNPISKQVCKRISLLAKLLLIVLVVDVHQGNAQTNPVNVFLDSTKQIIQGFGAANIVGWRPDMTSDEIAKAFGTGDGQIGFTVLRLRVPPNSNDFNLQVSTAKKAYDMGVKIIASPWTPPASMKTNNNIVGGELKESSYADYAAHLKSFADFMMSNGVPLYAISVQNEPDISVTYESCDWTAAQMVKFIAENASSIGTRIIAPESFQFLRPISDAILNDSAACANVDIIGGHIYGGGLFSYPLAEQKGKEVWMTEHLTESAHSANIWSLAMAVGQEIQQVMLANMSSYIWWYIVRYYGPIADGEKSTSFPNENFSAKGEITKKGYIMSQFSRFIRPGFYRIQATAISQREIFISAYKSDTRVVIVAINNSASPKVQTFTLANGSVAKFTPYVTSQSKNCEQGIDIEVTDNNFTAALDASSITTFVSDESLVPVELTSFIADPAQDKIQLLWVTSSEKNNRGFEVQRSIDKKVFVTIGYVEGKGTTAESQTYSYVDFVNNGKIFYRLKQIDYNGSFDYSNIIEVNAIPTSFNLLQNFPNPFNPVTKISYSLPTKTFMSLKVYDIDGNEVAQLFEGYQEAGNHLTLFDGSNLSSGVYFYRLSSPSFSESKKLILLK